MISFKKLLLFIFLFSAFTAKSQTDSSRFCWGKIEQQLNDSTFLFEIISGDFPPNQLCTTLELPFMSCGIGLETAGKAIILKQKKNTVRVLLREVDQKQFKQDLKAGKYFALSWKGASVKKINSELEMNSEILKSLL